MPSQKKIEAQSLQTVRTRIKEYIKDSDVNYQVKDYLNNLDDETILLYIRGRKYDTEKAWTNLKRYAELKLIKYPEMFPKEMTPALLAHHQRPTAAVLKSLDSQGRRIIVLDVARWNVIQNSLLDLCVYGTFIMENLMRDEDCIKNGLVVVHDGSTLGLQHLSQYTVKALLRVMNIFWHAYPISYKAIYVVQTPFFLSCVINAVKIFCPKKLKERLTVWSTDRGYEDLHKVISPEILPKSMGGILEFEEVIDLNMAVQL